jgi:hypothetical protein
MTNQRLGRVVRGLNVMLSVFLLIEGIGASPVSAQVKFLRPSRGVDIRNYKTLEECAALTDRVWDSIQRHNPLSTDIDTFPYNIAVVERKKPFPPVLTEAAQACVAQIPASNEIAPEDAQMRVPLLLRANRDEEANHIIEQLIAKTPPFNGTEADSKRTGAIQGALYWYANARPIRFHAALQLVLKEANSTTVPYRRIWLLSKAADLATKLNDSTRAKELTTLVLGEYHKMSPQQVSNLSPSQQRFMHNAVGSVTRQELIDSLRSSVSAYITLRKTDNRFLDRIPNGARVGERATPLQGEYWFTHGSPNATKALVRPSPGKTSLIVFLSTACRRSIEEREPRLHRGSARQECFGTYAMLKRLLQQFPNVELTIATQTYGYFWPGGPLQPEEEADYLRQWLLDFQKLPGALVVATTPFWHLDAPDNRRINDAISNEMSYVTTPLHAVLVDRDGIIIERFEKFTREQEEWVTQLLSILEGKG